MATMTVHWLGRGASAAIETASSSDGIESMTSTVRITNESIQPPNAPAMMPSVMPPMKPKTVAKTPTMRVWRLPTSRRESMSRPRLSAPSGKPASGPGMGLLCGRTLSRRSPAVGSCGAMRGEKIASTMNSRVTAAPMRKIGVAAQSAPRARDEGDTGGVVDGAGLAHGTVLDGRADARGARARGELVDPLLLALRAQGVGLQGVGHGVTSSGRGGRSRHTRCPRAGSPRRRSPPPRE